MVYWFIGQPGSGKTTLAKKLKEELLNDSIIIDGDDIRDIYQNKDYSENGRRFNIQRAQDLSNFLNHKGFDVIIAVVAPYRDQREEFKNKMGDKLIEFYVHTTETRGRESFHVSNYEPPISNFIDVDTTNEDIDVTFKKIKSKLYE